MRPLAAALILGATGVLASGVRAAEPSEPAAPVAVVAPTATAEAEANAAATDEFYDPVGRRDPFRPPQARAIATVGLDRSPLQRYELGQLKLVAVIYDTNAPRALVEDEAGLGYIIKVGTEIGVNGGIVRAIDRGRVLVEEESVDFFGTTRAAEVILEMASGERGSR